MRILEDTGISRIKFIFIFGVIIHNSRHKDSKQNDRMMDTGYSCSDETVVRSSRLVTKIVTKNLLKYVRQIVCINILFNTGLPLSGLYPPASNVSGVGDIFCCFTNASCHGYFNPVVPAGGGILFDRIHQSLLMMLSFLSNLFFM